MKIRLIVVVGVAALIVAGCGSSNKLLSYSGLADEANKICKAGNAELAKIHDVKAQADVIEKKYLPKLKALKAPDALKSSLASLISTTEQQITAIRGGDNKALAKLSQDSDLAASKLGAKECITKNG